MDKIVYSYLLLLNLCLFWLMGEDKRRAIKRKRRIPEKTLLLLGLIGGGLAGLVSQKIFHHKTRKKYFTMVYLIGGAIALTLIYYMRKWS